jgi:alpha-mannosidase
LPVVVADPSDTWSHGVLTFNAVAGRFEGARTTLSECGPVKATIRSESAYGGSRVTQEFTLYRDLEYVDVQVTVDWHEQFAMLKLAFPLNLYLTTATYDIPYGTIERPANGEEEPGGAWIDLTGVARNDGRILGMSIANDAKYSYSVTEHTVNVTVLRSPIYAHHDPYKPVSGGTYTFTDQGRQRFRYRLLPHAGSWRDAGTVQRAAELNRALIPQIESCHPGPLPQENSFLSVSAPNVIVPVLKWAEDGRAFVLRCFETTGRRTQAVIHMPHWRRRIEAEFGPGELKTFVVPVDEAQPIRETDLIEWGE